MHYWVATHSAWREMTESAYRAEVDPIIEINMPPAPVEPPPDEEVPDEPDIEGEPQ